MNPIGRIRPRNGVTGVGGVGPVAPVVGALPSHSVRGGTRAGLDTFSMAGKASRDPFGATVRTSTGLDGAFTGSLGGASGALGVQGLAEAQGQSVSLRSNWMRMQNKTSMAIIHNIAD